MVIKFNVYKEVLPNSDGSIKTPSPVGQTSEVYIEDISVSTSLESTIITVGNIPEIIPLGPKERVCRIVGSFKNNMINDIGNEVKDETFLTPLQYDDKKQLGMFIKSNNSSELPELGNAYWRIDEWTWNRDAKKIGKYEFSASLGYVWMNPAESKIYAENCANKKSQNVQFFANIEGTTYPIYNIKLHCSVFKTNVATFQLRDQDFDQYDKVSLTCSSVPNKVFFEGFIKSKSNTTSGEIIYECWENGCALYEVKCCNPKPGLFKPAQMVRTNVNGKRLKVKEVADTILKNNYVDHDLIDFMPSEVTFRSNVIASLKTIPGRGSNVWLPTQVISGMNVGNALESFLTNQCNLYIWYETNKIETGFIRDKITLNDNNKSKWFIENSEKISGNDETIKPDYVIVFDVDGNAKCYPPAGLTGKAKSIAYKLNTSLIDMGLDAYAQKVYEDLVIVDKSKYKVRFPAGTIEFKEADYFEQIGDLTITPSMNPRYYNDSDPLSNPNDSVWQIKEVTIMDDGTDVIIGPSYRSIFDIYGANLQICAEAPTPTEAMKWTSANIVAGEPDNS